MTALDTTTRALSLVGLIAEGLCAMSFVICRKVRALPLVFSYLSYLFLSDAFLILVAQKSESWPALVISTYIGYFVEVAAIWELTCRLLGDRDGRAVSERLHLTALWCIFLVLGTILMTNMQSYSEFGFAERRFLQIDLSVSIFRALAFIAILVFLRLEISGRRELESRLTLVFTAYAICDLLKHILNELGPWLQHPVGTFEVSYCVCGFIWVTLLFALSWQMLRLSNTRFGASDVAKHECAG